MEMATKKCAEKKYFLLQFNSNDVGGQLSNFEYSHSVRIVNKSSHGISSSNRRWNGNKWIEFVLHSTAYFHLISFFLRSQTHKIQYTGDKWTEFASRQNRQQQHHQNCQFTMSHGNDKSTCDAISENKKFSTGHPPTHRVHADVWVSMALTASKARTFTHKIILLLLSK